MTLKVRCIRTCEMYDVDLGLPLGKNVDSYDMYEFIGDSELPDGTPCIIIAAKGFPRGVLVKNVCFECAVKSGHPIKF